MQSTAYHQAGRRQSGGGDAERKSSLPYRRAPQVFQVSAAAWSKAGGGGAALTDDCGRGAAGHRRIPDAGDSMRKITTPEDLGVGRPESLGRVVVSGFRIGHGMTCTAWWRAAADSGRGGRPLTRAFWVTPTRMCLPTR